MKALGLLFFLSACATAPQVCLPLKAYTPAEEQAMATALLALPEDSIILSWMGDYGELRAADKACEGK